MSSDVAANTALVLDTSVVGISTDRQGIETAWDAATGFAKNEVRAHGKLTRLRRVQPRGNRQGDVHRVIHNLC